MEITIPWAPIKALAHLAGEGDIRPWVNGVWIDSAGPTRIVVATNGTVLGVFRTEEPSTNVPPVLVPLHIIKACKTFAADASIQIDDIGRASIGCLGTKRYWQNEKLAMPDFRRVIPCTPCEGPTQQFDAHQLAVFLKVRKALGKKDMPAGVRIAHAGARTCALVTLYDTPEFVGAIAPLNPDAKGVAPLATTAPAWVHSTTAFVREPAAEDLA